MYGFLFAWRALWTLLWFAIEKSLLPLSVDIAVDRALRVHRAGAQETQGGFAGMCPAAFDDHIQHHHPVPTASTYIICLGPLPFSSPLP